MATSVPTRRTLLESHQSQLERLRLGAVGEPARYDRSREKASGISTPARSETTPLACSTTIRFFQCLRELLVDVLDLNGPPMLEDADSCQIGKSTSHCDIALVHR